MMEAGSGVRSRMTQTTSNARSRSTRASTSVTVSEKISIDARDRTSDQSAIVSATPW